jgi:hypothetical protein
VTSPAATTQSRASADPVPPVLSRSPPREAGADALDRNLTPAWRRPCGSVSTLRARQPAGSWRRRRPGHQPRSGAGASVRRQLRSRRAITRRAQRPWAGPASATVTSSPSSRQTDATSEPVNPAPMNSTRPARATVSRCSRSASMSSWGSPVCPAATHPLEDLLGQRWPVIRVVRFILDHGERARESLAAQRRRGPLPCEGGPTITIRPLRTKSSWSPLRRASAGVPHRPGPGRMPRR